MQMVVLSGSWYPMVQSKSKSIEYHDAMIDSPCFAGHLFNDGLSVIEATAATLCACCFSCYKANPMWLINMYLRQIRANLCFSSIFSLLFVFLVTVVFVFPDTQNLRSSFLSHLIHSKVFSTAFTLTWLSLVPANTTKFTSWTNKWIQVTSFKTQQLQVNQLLQSSIKNPSHLQLQEFKHAMQWSIGIFEMMDLLGVCTSEIIAGIAQHRCEYNLVSWWECEL